MKFLLSFLLCLVVSATVIGCKNDPKEKEVTKTTKVKKEKKPDILLLRGWVRLS